MKYMLLIYENEATMPPPEGEDIGPWFVYTDELAASGKMVGGQALKRTATATTVREKNGSVVMMDGPFAETKEQLGGYYIVDAKDLDEARHWAAKMPHIARGGSVEIRPLMEFDNT